MIRVGLAGFGLAGAVFHAPLIRACRRMELCAVQTSRDVRLAVGSLDELFDRSDLIVVATPNATHFPIAKAALEAGKHVIVDKPFTVSVEEADQLIDLARQSERKIGVFHNRRWDSDFLTVRSVLPRIGELSLYEACWDRFRTDVRDSWKEKPGDGSGLLADLGPHLVDQALQLFGWPDALDADVAIQRPAAKVDDYFRLTLHYGRMRAVLSASSLIAHPRPRFALHGAGGSFVKHGLDPQEEQLRAGVDPLSSGFGIDPTAGSFTGPDGNLQVASERGRYLAFYEGVADALLGGAAMPVDATDARAVMALLAGARQGAREGVRVDLPC